MVIVGKVSNNNPAQVVKLQGPVLKEKNQAHTNTDRVEISDEAKLLIESEKDYDFTVEKRNKINDLKARILNGEYVIDPEKIAKSMLERIGRK